jgi:hypothetical protein
MQKLKIVASGAWLILLLSCIAVGAQENPDSLLTALLPQEGDMPAWRQTFAPRFFGEDDLFEYIDGAADLYLQYGFRRVLTTDYAVGPDSNSVTVEIYAMKSPLHAFGIFAAERSPDEAAVAIGVEGYQSANVLNFYQGSCYVKLTSFTLDKNLWPALQEMGRFLAARIGGDDAPPATFAFFPADDAMPASDRYVPADFMGQSYFREGYRREYRESTCGSWQLFLIPCKNGDEAEELFGRYSDFLTKQGAPHTRETLAGHPTIVVREADKITLALYTERFICGALGPACEPLLKTRLAQMVALFLK